VNQGLCFCKNKKIKKNKKKKKQSTTVAQRLRHMAGRQG